MQLRGALVLILGGAKLRVGNLPEILCKGNLIPGDLLGDRVLQVAYATISEVFPQNLELTKDWISAKTNLTTSGLPAAFRSSTCFVMVHVNSPLSHLQQNSGSILPETKPHMSCVFIPNFMLKARGASTMPAPGLASSS